MATKPHKEVLDILNQLAKLDPRAAKRIAIARQSLSDEAAEHFTFVVEGEDGVKTMGPIEILSEAIGVRIIPVFQGDGEIKRFDLEKVSSD